MTPESRFLVFAALGLAYFASQLLFGNSVGSTYTQEWTDSKQSPLLRTFDRFLLILNLRVQSWAILPILVLLSIVVLLLFLEIAPGMKLGAMCAAVVFFVAACRIIKDFCAWQATRFEERLGDAIDVMTAALATGAGPVHALNVVARWTEGRVSQEFQEIVRRLEIGFDIEQAVEQMIRAYDSEGVRLFCQSLQAKWHVGGDLAEVLAVTSRVVRERNRMRMQAAGQLSGMRSATLFVAAMPYVLYTFFLLFQPKWVAAIHANPTGTKLLYAALALQMLGFLWLSRTLRADG